MKRKVLYWILLTIAYIHLAMKYGFVGYSVDALTMFYLFGVLPLGYAGFLVIFKTRKD